MNDEEIEKYWERKKEYYISLQRRRNKVDLRLERLF
jgi:hypothetical protein